MIPAPRIPGKFSPLPPSQAFNLHVWLHCAEG
jgi:hypothetical protein